MREWCISPIYYLSYLDMIKSVILVFQSRVQTSTCLEVWKLLEMLELSKLWGKVFFNGLILWGESGDK